MKITYTEPALEDLDDLRRYISDQYPDLLAIIEARIHSALARIVMWPESAQEVAQRPGVRVVPLVRYPYKIFYQVGRETIEVLHVYNSARDEF